VSKSESKQLQHLVDEVSRRSKTDPDFRALALRDSSAAIAKIGSERLPENVKIKFVDNSGPVVTIPLPDPVPSEQLSEMELENVAGGVESLDTIAVQGQWSKA